MPHLNLALCVLQATFLSDFVLLGAAGATKTLSARSRWRRLVLASLTLPFNEIDHTTLPVLV